MPLFSVVTPAHNSEATVARAIESVLEQEMSDLELLMVDDGSTDGTGSVVESVSDPRLRYLRAEHCGVSAARNHGIAQSEGDIVTFLDSDDLAYPEWLATLSSLLDDDQVGIAFCGMHALHPDGHSSALAPRPGFFGWATPSLFLSGSYAVRRSLLDRVQGFDERLTYSENTDLGIRLMQACDELSLATAYTEVPLVAWSYPDEQRQNDPARLHSRIAACEILLKKYRDHPALGRDRRVKSYHLAIAGVASARLGNPRDARQYFARAIWADPRQPANYARWAATWNARVAARFWSRRPDDAAPAG